MNFRENINLTIDKLSSISWMLFAVFFIAIWSIFIQDGHINRDGILYLKQAYLIAEGDYKEALELFPYPFYSFLIGNIHKFLGIPLQLIAHSLNLILFMMAVYYFLRILQFISNQKDIVFFGGITLASFIPIMDDYLGMVIRDHGYWAGIMMGFYYFLLNRKDSCLKFFIIWHLAFFIAALFRPEALVFIAASPLIIYLTKYNRSHFFKNHVVLFIFLMIVLGIIQSIVPSLLNLEYLDVVMDKIKLIIPAMIAPAPFYTDDFWLNKLLQDKSLLITYSAFIGVLIYKWLTGLGILHGPILFFGAVIIKFKTITRFRAEIAFFALVSILLVFVNFLSVYVISGRYLMLHFWFILLVASILMREAFRSKKIRDFYKVLLSILITVQIMNVLIDKHERDLEREVAESIRISNFEGDCHSLGADRVLYYAGLPMQKILRSTTTNLKTNDILVVADFSLLAEVAGSLNLELVNSYSLKQKKIEIFKVIN